MIVAITSLITLTGLWLVLRKYLGAGTTALSLLLLFVGTNFFVMTVFSGALQASILLMLMTLVVWMTQRWYDKPGLITALVAGLVMGCLVFIKPAGFASVLLFFFWDAYDKESFQKKWKMFRERPVHLILVFGLFFTGLALRLIFPNAFDGSWFSDYVQHKRALYLLAPWLWMVLFSIKNGWLIYTPLALFAIPGFYILAGRNKRIFYATFLFSLSFILLLASTPDAGRPDNFSQVRATEIFAVIIIPLGYFLNWVLEGRWPRRTLFGLILVALACLNLFQTWQYRTKILNPWFMTPGYYQAVFLKTKVSGETKMKQEFSNMDMSSYLVNENDFNVSTIISAGFENDPSGFGGHIQDRIVKSGKGAIRLDTGLRFTPNFDLTLSKLPSVYPLGIRFSAEVYSETDFGNNPGNLIITLRHQGQFYRYQTVPLKDFSPEKGKWISIRSDYVIPRLYDPADELIPCIWYTGSSAMYVDDLKVELFEQK